MMRLVQGLPQSLVRATRTVRIATTADTIRPRQTVYPSAGAGLNNPALLVAANALQAVITYAQIHGGDPTLSGLANTNSVARQLISWIPPTPSGHFDLAAPLVFTGMTPFSTCSWISLWGAANGGATYGNFPVTSGGTIADASGNYTWTSLPIDGAIR